MRSLCKHVLLICHVDDVDEHIHQLFGLPWVSHTRQGERLIIPSSCVAGALLEYPCQCRRMIDWCPTAPGSHQTPSQDRHSQTLQLGQAPHQSVLEVLGCPLLQTVMCKSLGRALGPHSSRQITPQGELTAAPHSLGHSATAGRMQHEGMQAAKAACIGRAVAERAAASRGSLRMQGMTERGGDASHRALPTEAGHLTAGQQRPMKDTRMRHTACQRASLSSPQDTRQSLRPTRSTEQRDSAGCLPILQVTTESRGQH